MAAGGEAGVERIGVFHPMALEGLGVERDAGAGAVAQGAGR